MRYFFLCSLLLLQVVVTHAQLLYPYKDTTNDYYIGLPEKWRYWRITDNPNVTMMARDDSPLADSSKQFADNINVAIMKYPGIEVDSAFFYLAAATSPNRLEILDTGSYVVNGKKMLWLDDVHIGGHQNDTLSASMFVVCSKDKAYLITCTSTAVRFPTKRALFHQMAQTFKSDLPAKQELIKIALPVDRKWKINLDNDDSTKHFKQIIPSTESPDHWTTVISFISEKNSEKENMKSILTKYSALLKQTYRNPKYTLLSQSEKSALFKIESTEDDPESNLCYLVRGTTRWHILNLSIHQGSLPADVVKQWTEIFRQSEIVIE
jgi:hypothetical protein